MTREQIEKAARDAVQNHFQCNGKYPCEERDYCEFCNGRNSAFDCKEDCGADDFNEGFIAGSQWRINSVWHDIAEEPENGSWIAISISTSYIKSIYAYKGVCSYFKIIGAKGWAYISDLLPERKEEVK